VTAKSRVRDELERRDGPRTPSRRAPTARSSPAAASSRDAQRARLEHPEVPEDFQARASREGKVAQAIAADVLEGSGFTIVQRNSRLRGLGVTVNFVALDAEGCPWYFDVCGAFTTTRGGLLRTDSVWKSLGRASVLRNNNKTPVVLLTSHLPRKGSEGHNALRAAGPEVVFDAIEMLDDEQAKRLASYALGGHETWPEAGFWSEKDLSRP
jgi:hypothetical protein